RALMPDEKRGRNASSCFGARGQFVVAGSQSFGAMTRADVAPRTQRTDARCLYRGGTEVRAHIHDGLGCGVLVSAEDQSGPLRSGTSDSHGSLPTETQSSSTGAR